MRLKRRPGRSRAPKSNRSIPTIVLRATQLVTCPLVVPAAVFVAPDSPFRDELIENAGLIVGGLLVLFFAATAMLDSGTNVSSLES